MIARGFFTQDGAGHARAVMPAFFVNEANGYRCALDFIVDTGADRTFIVPAHQAEIGIKDIHLQNETKPTMTLSGSLSFQFMRNCTLFFTTPEGEPWPLQHTFDAYFSPRNYRGSICKLLSRFTSCPFDGLGRGQYYSLLGLDVLKHLSLAFSSSPTTKDVFITNACIKYLKAIYTEFPKPGDEASDDPWIG